MTDTKEFTHRFNIAAWLDDQIEDGCVEVPAGKEKALAHFLYQNFDFTEIWDQLESLTQYYLSARERNES